MWYFYKKFDSEELQKLINKLNCILEQIISEEDFKYPVWMTKIKLHKYYEKFNEKYLLSLPNEKLKIKEALTKNIQIEKICKSEISPISYDDLLIGASKNFKECITSLEEIQRYLYDNLFEIKSIKESVGNLKDYYDNFHKESIIFVCPFCGLANMLTSKDRTREAFDHYLPRSKFPFVSLLRENLFPICSTCNTNYKRVKNITEYGRIFYPFTTEFNDCELTFEVSGDEVLNTRIISSCFESEIETWDKVFDIKNRVKNFANDNMQGWISNIQETMSRYGVDYLKVKDFTIEECKGDMQDNKFVKAAIFEALPSVELKKD